MILIIDDDEIMAECIARACRKASGASVRVVPNAIEAMRMMGENGADDASGEAGLPDLIFLDIMLDGPDGFTFLNELVSYSDTAKIPVVIVSSLDLGQEDLSAYGVVGVLDKSQMRPEEVVGYVQKYTK